MSINILNGEAHTCRHGLKSLLYAFAWVSMNFSAVSRDKACDLSHEGFVKVVDEFQWTSSTVTSGCGKPQSELKLKEVAYKPNTPPGNSLNSWTREHVMILGG